MILKRQTITQTLTKERLAQLTIAQIHALDFFIAMLALRKIEIARQDIRSGDSRRRSAGLSFLYSDFAELLCSGIGLDIECIRMRMDTLRFFIEIPDLKHEGKRFRSSMRPVVIAGLIRPIEGRNTYRIVIQEPETFAENYHTVTSEDWIEVDGPARWLTETEYIELLDESGVDKRLVAVARAAAKDT